MKKENFKIQGGYTIIETMIAISLFIVIIMAGMGALLNANSVHNKSQDTMSILDSLNFVMDEMSTNLRTGYNYNCVKRGPGLPANISATQDCSSSEGIGVAFEEENGDLYRGSPPTLYNDDQWIYYIRNTEEEDSSGNAIYGIFKSINGTDSGAFQLTPSEVHINPDESYFVVSGAGSSDTDQPFVTVKLVGEIVYKDTTTPFSLRTSVSQRNIDI
jgi:type II secretory pathway pseudopilin PulG